MKKKGLLLFFALVMMSSLSFGYQVTERCRLGAVVEGTTYIGSGPMAGKVAVLDGWSVYIHDPVLGNYEHIFSLVGKGFAGPPRGIAYLGLGDYAGHFLLTNNEHPNSFLLFTVEGVPAGTFQAQGFESSHSEGLTQIVGGPDNGKIALAALDAFGSNKVFVFRLENIGGELSAALDSDIPNVALQLACGIAYLPPDFPESAFADTFVISDVEAGVLNVVDRGGTRLATYPGIRFSEGLNYVPSGSNAGKLLIVDMVLLQASYRNLDGSVSVPASFPTIGLSLFGVLNFTWLKDRQQLHVVQWDGQDYDLPASLISRLGRESWRLDEQFRLTHLRLTRNITDMTADGTYKLFGILTPRGIPARWGVDHLNASFALLGTTNLPDEYINSPFGVLVYVPGETVSGDRFVTPRRKTVLSFDALFRYPADVIDLSSFLENNISKMCYDPAGRRYFIIDGTRLRIVDFRWTLLHSVDLSGLAYGPYSAVARITSGELRGQIAVLNADNNELIILNFEYELAVILLDQLIAEVRAAGLPGGITTSLVEKLINARAAVDRMDLISAVNMIKSFQLEVRAKSGSVIPTSTAERWLELAAEIIRGLQQLL